MNRKEYLIAQGNVQKDISALAETLKTQLAVLPEAIKVGEELKVIGFKGETLNDGMGIEYPTNKEVIEYENKYAVTWHKGKYYIQERVLDSIFKPIKECNSLEEVLAIYSDLLEKEEIKI